MFTELYAVARHTPLQISVSPEGARLNVLIIPKPGDDADEASALAKPIQAIGTPEELDRELPAKLAEYCAAINDLRLKIDLPIEAITAEAGKGGRTKKKANTPARTPARASAPKPVKKAAPKPVKPIKKAAAVKPAKPLRSTNDIIRAKRRSQEISAAQAKQIHDLHAPAAAKKHKRATREECLADLRAYFVICERSNLAITRALFIEHNTTGRSYERKFKTWDEFLLEGRKPEPDQGGSQSDVPPAQNGNADAPEAGIEAPPAKETLSKTTINPALKWPFPETQASAEPPAKHISRVIYSKEGRMLGTSLEALDIGDEYTHMQLGMLHVTEVVIHEDGSERITVASWSDAPTATTAVQFPVE